ncbi:MAG: hypothetical protein KAR81_01560, partial [Sulfurimonas sp.]|nr:hypothetical protein [Sulfurimonas sp.]
MFKLLVKTVVLLSLTATVALAYQAIRLNVSEGKTKERNSAFEEIVEVDLEDIGFFPKDIHPSIEYHYKRFYGTKTIKKTGKPNPK